MQSTFVLVALIVWSAAIPIASSPSIRSEDDIDPPAKLSPRPCAKKNQNWCATRGFGPNANEPYGFPAMDTERNNRSSMCCDIVSSRNGLGALCLCLSPLRYPTMNRSLLPTLDLDLIFYLPWYQPDVPDWFEQLAQLCNAATVHAVLAISKETGLAVILEHAFDDVQGLLEKATSGLLAFARDNPKPAIDPLDEAHAYSGMITAAVIQHLARTAVVLPPGCQHTSLSCVRDGLVAFTGMSPTDASRKGERVGNVTAAKQVHAGMANKGGKPHTGQHFFSCKRSCDLYRQALSVFWPNSIPHDTPTKDGYKRKTMRIVVVNRPHDSRNISNCEAVVAALEKAFPDSEVALNVREGATFEEQMRVYREADVVVVAHGGSMVNVPLMREGSLLIEVFTNPLLDSAALSSFLGLGTHCGITHRAYPVKIPLLSGARISPNNAWPVGVGHDIDPSVLVSMIREWQVSPTLEDKMPLNDRGTMLVEEHWNRLPFACSGGCSTPEERAWWEGTSPREGHDDEYDNEKDGSGGVDDDDDDDDDDSKTHRHGTISPSLRRLPLSLSENTTLRRGPTAARKHSKTLLRKRRALSSSAPGAAAAAAAAAASTCFDTASLGPPYGGNNGTEFEGLHDDRLRLSECERTKTLGAGGGSAASAQLARFRSKLLGQCGEALEVAVLGGSVSCGNFISNRKDGPCPSKLPLNKNSKWNQGCKESAFPAFLEAILRRRRFEACGGGSTLGGAGGSSSRSIRGGGEAGLAEAKLAAERVTVVNHCRRACGSNFFVQRISGDSPSGAFLRSADLVVVETSQNDVADVGVGPDSDPANAVEGWTELLVRQLLSVLPKRPALVWLGAAWRGFEGGQHRCSAEAHRAVLKRYGLPQVSMLEAFEPLNAPATIDFLKNVYFADNLHPSVLGHKMIASVLAFNLLFLLGPSDGSSSSSRGATTLPPLVPLLPPPPLPPLQLPEPQAVSPVVAAMYTGGECSRLNLADPQVASGAMLKTRQRHHYHHSGGGSHLGSAKGGAGIGTGGVGIGSTSPPAFTVFEDVAGKPGLIATTPGSIVQLRLDVDEKPAATAVGSSAPPTQKAEATAAAAGGRSGRQRQWLVMLGFLSSYVGMGTFDVKVVHHCGACSSSSGDSTSTSNGEEEEEGEVEEDTSDAFTSEAEGHVLASATLDGLHVEQVSIYTTALLTTRPVREGSCGGAGLAAAECLYLQVSVNPDAKRKQHKVKLYDVTWAPI